MSAKKRDNKLYFDNLVDDYINKNIDRQDMLHGFGLIIKNQIYPRIEKKIRQQTLNEVKTLMYFKLKENGSKNALNCVDETIKELNNL